MIPAVHHLVKRKRAVAAVSPQSPSNSSISTDTDQAGKNPAASFGANEWLVDEIYQQYLQDPNSVDRAWWDFFADYKPGAAAASAPAGTAAAGAAGTTTAQAAAPAAPAATTARMTRAFRETAEPDMVMGDFMPPLSASPTPASIGGGAGMRLR